MDSSPPPTPGTPDGVSSTDNNDRKFPRPTTAPLDTSSTSAPRPQAPSSPAAIPSPPTSNVFSDSLHMHGLDLPWVTRDLYRSSSPGPLTGPNSPSQHGLPHRLSELNLSAHPSRHAHARKNQSRTACFVHSLLSQNGPRARSPTRTGSSDDLTRGSILEVINKGPERRDRWNRGMTKKELSGMALGVRELSKRLGTHLHL